MTEQPWAVRLADITEYKKYPRHPDHDTHVAAELRRLHEVNVELFRLVNLVHGSFEWKYLVVE